MTFYVRILEISLFWTCLNIRVNTVKLDNIVLSRGNLLVIKNY